MQLKQGTKLQGGKYEILRTLGQGGFGITYEALHVMFGRKIAIKEFFMKDVCTRDEHSSLVSVPTVGSKELVEKFKRKFIKEALTIVELDHSNIVRVNDVFEENGTAYYVMDNLPGGSLADKVKKDGPLPEAQAEKYIRQVADALAYIHERDTVHLDVKPSNILLNAKGDAVLIDFGISKHYDKSGEQTSSTPVGISKGYAPLEQGRAGDVAQFTPATDIYALGATLYYLLTGQTPPEASIVYEDGLERPMGISDRIWDAIYIAMQPKRKDRPQCINAFINLLGNSTHEISTVFNASSNQSLIGTILSIRIFGISRPQKFWIKIIITFIFSYLFVGIGYGITKLMDNYASDIMYIVFTIVGILIGSLLAFFIFIWIWVKPKGSPVVFDNESFLFEKEEDTISVK